MMDWKLLEKIEDMSDQIESIEEYLTQVNLTHEAFNTWIQSATEIIQDLQKQVKYLNNKKTAI